MQRSGVLGAAMLSVAGRCPPLGVHPFGSDVRGPVVQPSGVQPSGVRSSGSVVRDPAVRPTGVRPSGGRTAGVHRSVRSHPSRPRKPRGWPWGSGRCGGQPSRPGRIELHVVCGVPGGSVDGPSRPGGGRPGGGGAEAGGGASVADLAGSCSGAGCGRARPLTGQGPARREGRPSLPAKPGHGRAG